MWAITGTGRELPVTSMCIRMRGGVAPDALGGGRRAQGAQEVWGDGALANRVVAGVRGDGDIPDDREALQEVVRQGVILPLILSEAPQEEGGVWV